MQRYSEKLYTPKLYIAACLFAQYGSIVGFIHPQPPRSSITERDCLSRSRLSKRANSPLRRGDKVDLLELPRIEMLYGHYHESLEQQIEMTDTLALRPLKYCFFAKWLCKIPTFAY